MFINMNLEYPILLIKAGGKRSFEGLGSLINRSGDTVKRRLNSVNENFSLLSKIAVIFFLTGSNSFLSLMIPCSKKFIRAPCQDRALLRYEDRQKDNGV